MTEEHTKQDSPFTAQYERARDEFDGLKIEQKAIFLVEATVSTIARGIETAGRTLTEEMDKIFREAERHADEAAEDLEEEVEAAAEAEAKRKQAKKTARKKATGKKTTARKSTKKKPPPPAPGMNPDAV